VQRAPTLRANLRLHIRRIACRTFEIMRGPFLRRPSCDA